MPKPNTSFYVGLGIIIIVIAYIEVCEIELHKHGILLNAKTTNWALSSYMGMDLKYEFYYKGEKITGANAFEPFRGDPDFENRYFPVMYYPRWGGHSQLLIRPSDFKDFNIPFPDSLKWVLP